MQKSGKLRILPLGGLGEVGKNMMLIDYENEGIIIDVLSSEEKEKNLPPSTVRNNTYKNWNYMEKL